MADSSNSLSLQIDIVSDVVCPWCIIGYKQLEKALQMMPGQFNVKYRWHPFELIPQMPPEGQELGEHLRQKYGARPGGGDGARQRLTELGESLGFQFDYYDGMRMVNTFRAHCLLFWAESFGLQTPLKLALFEAFFTHRRNVWEIDVLVDVAATVGLPAMEARELLNAGSYAQRVRQEQQLWLDKDIHAVPAFYFNEQYFVHGAQEAETFQRILGKIKTKAELTN